MTGVQTCALPIYQLAEELLFGKLVGGGSVTVSVSEDGTKLKLDSTPTQLPEVTA